MSATQHARRTADRAARSKSLKYLARSGFVCYGVIHLLFAWLALQVAFGHSTQESDQSGALSHLASLPAGKVLLVLIVLGMVALAVWQALTAALGLVGGVRGKEAIAHRVVAGVRAVVYLWLAWTGVKVLRGGANASQSSNQQRTTSHLMNAAGGRWLVGLVGVVVVGVGVGLIWFGLTKRFEQNLETLRMRPTVRRSTRRLGVAGYGAKGVAYGIAGVLLVAAAVTYDAGKARGLDGALKTLAGQSYGPWLLALVALGIAAFGVFCFSQAKYRKV
jgi:Domain of Unknown Function (DUF1206)